MLQWTQKVWEGDMVFEEPLCFLQLSNDVIISGELLYVPSKILKITSADGSCTYEEGKDYTVNGKKLLRTVNSKIPVLLKDTYCIPYTGDKDTEWLRMEDREYYVRIFPEVYQYQVLVTYQHEEIWEGFIPENVTTLLPRTVGMLSEKEHVNLVFYGDSITAGWEASGCDENVINMSTLKEFHNFIHRPPYLPAWASLVTNAIMEHYGYKDITKINRGAGGSTTAWGNANAAGLVNPHKPDLVVLGFGMNNAQEEPEEYEAEILGIISTIRGQNPDCEFLLVSPMIPNSEIQVYINNKLAKHQEVLLKLQKSMRGVGVAPVNSVFHELSRYGKHYLDISGNCINHPNDFSVRIYAQTILSALGI
jgi:lysophospholipase L1-like esterase